MRQRKSNGRCGSLIEARPASGYVHYMEYVVTWSRFTVNDDDRAASKRCCIAGSSTELRHVHLHVLYRCCGLDVSIRYFTRLHVHHVLTCRPVCVLYAAKVIDTQVERWFYDRLIERHMHRFMYE